MEDNKVLVLDNVSVRYRKSGARTTADIVKGLFSKSKSAKGFWALRNVSFSLERGDMLGVIGKNGAGKSTMMKAISGTITPVTGSIERNGKLCALLELGAGFDKEMTVKENVYLRGALLGYSKEYIDSKYDEIIDYAEMREFENNPFRTLSSGMKSRIAFSIASLVEPDIIILDEIFAVGDGAFRQRSQERMQEIIGSGNTTALIVSHSLTAVRKQCTKVLWLDKGRMVMFGEPNEVCDEYKKYLDTGVLPQTESLEKAKKEPLDVKKHKRGKLFAEIAVYAMLIFAALAGAFVWSQYDLLKSYVIAKNASTEELLDNADDCHKRIDRLLHADTSNWDYSTFEKSAPLIVNDELSYSEVAKEVLRNAGTVDSQSYKLTLAAAEVEAVKYVHIENLDRLVETMREEFNAQPEGKYRSLMVYAYTKFDRFYDLEEDCDDAMQDIIEEIRATQRKNGLPEELADQVWSAYKDEKVQLLAYYCIKLR